MALIGTGRRREGKVTLSAVTNMFIGICLTFASVALLVSTVTEGLASLLKLRASTLLDGLKSLLNAQTPPSRLRRLLPPIFRTLPALPADGGKPSAQILYDLLNHAAINPRGPGNCAKASAAGAPSYIPASHFAAALLDVVCKDYPHTLDGLSEAIDNIPDKQLKQLLQGIRARSGQDIHKMQSDIASWFDSAMNQVSGDYKRYAQLWTFLIALVLAALFNIDAIAIVHALLTQPALAGSIQVTAADVSQTPDMAAIKAYGLPIGWTSPQTTLGAFLGAGWDEVLNQPLLAFNHVAGWFIMATASLFGAPFWFDTLQRFVQLRGTGDKPAAPLPFTARAPSGASATAVVTQTDTTVPDGGGDAGLVGITATAAAGGAES
jgi:hypothetical protein